MNQNLAVVGTWNSRQEFDERGLDKMSRRLDKSPATQAWGLRMRTESQVARTYAWNQQVASKEENETRKGNPACGRQVLSHGEGDMTTERN